MNDARHGERHEATAERREPAPHPGPLIARDYLRPLGLDVREFAALVGMDGDRLAAMLAGTLSLDVDAAVRFGRSLGLPADRLMRAQMRHDFAESRKVELLQPVPASDVLADRAFPSDALHGHLTRTEGAEDRERFYFVADDDARSKEHGFERVHPIGMGDRLRIYAPDGAIAWAGPVLRNLDGRLLFAFAPARLWQGWFVSGARAEFSPAPP